MNKLSEKIPTSKYSKSNSLNLSQFIPYYTRNHSSETIPFLPLTISLEFPLFFPKKSISIFFYFSPSMSQSIPHFSTLSNGCPTTYSLHPGDLLQLLQADSSQNCVREWRWRSGVCGSEIGGRRMGEVLQGSHWRCCSAAGRC